MPLWDRRGEGKKKMGREDCDCRSVYVSLCDVLGVGGCTNSTAGVVYTVHVSWEDDWSWDFDHIWGQY